ncbi:hypothetical protein [Selenomonas ruminis]|uniref:Tetratricopeptide repeat protein n=2 Tax=Selenomonas TaxID=970 RepID=A0A5D6W671_9FIRM|nr:hypothetical protein [Selenomonas sp. mPRGC5]TYZ23951.1 hypothetical protein FZ040_04305 [Selenomonas sp. mPRGC5]
MRKGVICLLTLACVTLAGSGMANASQALNEDVSAVTAGEPAVKVADVITEDKAAEEEVLVDGTNSLNVSEKENPVEPIKQPLKKLTLEEELAQNQQLINDNELEKAIENLTAMIEERGCLVPARAYYLRSVAYFNMQKYNDALVDAQTASRLDVNEPLYYVQKGLIRLAISQMYDVMGQDAAVKEQCGMVEMDSDKSLEFQHRYWPALFCRAISNYMRGSIHKSLADCGDALKRGGRGVSFVEAFNVYVQAERSAEDTRFPGVDIQPVLFSSINGLMNADKQPCMELNV